MTKPTVCFDEMFAADGSVRPAYAGYQGWLNEQDPSLLRRKGAEAEGFFRRTGITFNVYGDNAGEERLIPFDMVPRIITANEWRKLTRGIEQRVRALNAFLHDIYHRQEIVRAGRVPKRLIAENDAFLPQMVGLVPPGGVFTHIVGIDLVRTGPDEFMVLEDNARTPSGVSYMLENRETMMAMFPELFTRVR
ncbi:MAG TPA: circularly permuted type 2 ATP-grasp protein, partial [Novosphingobium sp.]|nr:circularly permuted type 2 ATP-grasp protein [Novosphingobium sp.]